MQVQPIKTDINRCRWYFLFDFFYNNSFSLLIRISYLFYFETLEVIEFNQLLVLIIYKDRTIAEKQEHSHKPSFGRGLYGNLNSVSITHSNNFFS